MQPKPEINVRSRSTKIVKVEVTTHGTVDTADWPFKINPSIRVISSGSRAVKVHSGRSVDLTKVNRELRGKRDYANVPTSIVDKLETA